MFMQNDYLVKMASRMNCVIHKTINKFHTLTYYYAFIKYLLLICDLSHSVFDHVDLCTVYIHVDLRYWLRNEREIVTVGKIKQLYFL